MWHILYHAGLCCILSTYEIYEKCTRFHIKQPTAAIPYKNIYQRTWHTKFIRSIMNADVRKLTQPWRWRSPVCSRCLPGNSDGQRFQEPPSLPPSPMQRRCRWKHQKPMRGEREIKMEESVKKKEMHLKHLAWNTCAGHLFCLVCSWNYQTQAVVKAPSSFFFQNVEHSYLVRTNCLFFSSNCQIVL